MSKTIGLNIVSDPFIKLNVVAGHGIEIVVPVNLRQYANLSLTGNVSVYGALPSPELRRTAEAHGRAVTYGDLSGIKTTFCSSMDAMVIVHGDLEVTNLDYLDNMEGYVAVTGVMNAVLMRLRTIGETDPLHLHELDAMNLGEIEHIAVV